jgi:hypothetical protein
MGRPYFYRAIFSTSLSAGIALLAIVGCHSSYRAIPSGPAAPTATFTSTPTYACTYTTITLPGSYTNTLVIWNPIIAITPTVTPSPVPSLGMRGIIRNTSDWYSYCAVAGVDPSTAPPVDLATKMIIFRSKTTPECLITPNVLGFDCRSDMLVMSVHTLTDYSSDCLFPLTGNFEGYVVDQDPRPLFWIDYYEYKDTILWCPTCDIVIPYTTSGVLTPSQPFPPN